MATRNYIYQHILQKKIGELHDKDPKIKRYFSMSLREKGPYYNKELNKEIETATNIELDSALQAQIDLVQWYINNLKETFDILHAKEMEARRLEVEFLRLEPLFPFIASKNLCNIDTFISYLKQIKRPIVEARKDLWWGGHLEDLKNMLLKKNDANSE